MSFVTKANALKRKSIETKNEIDNLEKQIVDLEEKKERFDNLISKGFYE